MRNGVRSWLAMRRFEITLFGLALAARLGVVLAGGGLNGSYGYDASVYYAAADALIHGRLPYRDFVLLHPPGIMLVLTPFAWLGRFTSDHTGFITANLAFTVLGAANAVLVTRVATRLGATKAAALLGGCFYAVWFGSVGAEYLARLEPLGSFLALCGLLAFFAGDRARPKHAALLCGLAFGAAASVKIWWTVPLVVIVLARSRLVGNRPPRKWLLTGAAASLIAINGPFFLSAPGQMWHMVVTEQLGRARNGTSPWARLGELTYVDRIAPHLPVPFALLLFAVLALVGLAVVRAAWAVSNARPVVTLAVAQIVVVSLAPSWFGFYGDYVSVAVALTIAAAATRPRRHRVAGASVAVAFAAAVTTLVFALGDVSYVRPFPGRALAAAVAREPCVMSDSPMALIELNALSRGFTNGCRNWVDVTGRTYGVDKGALRPTGAHVRRRDNPRWQHDLRSYLLSGTAVIIIRRAGTGLSAATMGALARRGVLIKADGYTVYR